MKKSLLLILAAASLIVQPAQAMRGGRRAKDARAKESRLIEESLSERFKNMLEEKMPGLKAEKVLKGNGVSYKAIVPRISSLFRRAGINRELPLTFQNSQGLGRNVKRAMLSYATRNAQKSGSTAKEIAELRKKFQGRTVLGMYREVLQAEQVLNVVKLLDAKNNADAKLREAAEAMYEAGVKLFEAALHKYNEVATYNSQLRDPLRNPQVRKELEDLASFVAFGSIRLNEVLPESLKGGDLAALKGYAIRARAFSEAVAFNSSTSPMSDAISQILKGQGISFKNRQQQREEVERQRLLLQKECG